MTRMRTLSLSAIGITVFMAFVAATSAMAVTELEKVVLCKVQESPCAAANRFGELTALDAKATDPVLLSSVNIDHSVLCEKSDVQGRTGMTTLAHGEITSITWTNCKTNLGTEDCTDVLSNNPNYLLKVELNAGHTAYETLLTEIINGSPSVSIGCPNTSCTYRSNNWLMTVRVNGSNVTELVSNATLTGEGVCFFTSGTLEAAYVTKCLEGANEVNCYVEME